MMMFALLALFGGFAVDGSTGFGPYKVNPDLTTGRMEFFREVYVEPAQIGSLIQPAQPLPAASAPTGDLRIENAANGWIEVTIGGVRVGKIGPLTTAVIHDVPSGFYEVQALSANGLVVTKKIATTVNGEGPIVRDPAVQAPPLPQGSAPAQK